ncbi:TIGR03885 family FMN-dependent LLM class oxidoreductase [Limnoraphis robusta Tam1]|uniref:TIGR03885 family FMN-dependent LLM class oxidoreductase n=1 Tax=Limnoraphis robusta CCNP1315 TaxID=3110306 RepID=A0ABU5U1Q4_9CYAN|nr:TIGR03885 family FMN-dependent LLM class oxidoreductase [Limnoraphis robusta]MEA5495681.1 TIGR03885 family FMN-dependent LLM class oxidoreductase [Limnoraphis robusta BA-68 BA1]MEA5520975.1 TIGR03885 family FMN-dependent LLM class oxidoreductase [Limnoraphis robusta CCNP1315]MEA5538731.1 TIGR03885 family FMN-dependent LLM class oxidoreductase [Limnoraphis robusta Tam1]MEA5543579.1 TIGR03885 family FMN-dependent LLM class oxidoreductase [Limnoraphis robusta CCNP1324]
MVKIGYHASHEQFKPSQLLNYVQQADKAGFNLCLSSDHFYPWSEKQGQSGFAWSWLGAAMQATPNLSYRIVCAPGQRYHPAIIAQAAATLAEMFPDRFWLTVGSGQALNEQITGEKWPCKSDRNTRLKECVDIIRALWSGETVTHRGLVSIEEAKLYTRPETNPLMIGAAITAKTAQWLGSWADGLITTSRPPEQLKEVVEAFHRGGGQGKPMILKVQLSYHSDENIAKKDAYDQWRNNIFASQVLSDLKTPQQFDAIGEFVTLEDLEKNVRVSSNVEQHIEWLKQDIELGFDELILHNVNREQEQFIETFGKTVLPRLL